jgi:small subunit ribosomal protein S10
VPSPKKKPAARSSPKVPAEGSVAAAKRAGGGKKGTKQAQKGAQNIRIRLSAFDHTVLDEAAIKIIDTAERSGAIVNGPVPLPTKIRKFTINRATFAKKDARDQFEMRIHRRLIDLTETTFRTIDALQSLSLPSGVEVEIKMKA